MATPIIQGLLTFRIYALFSFTNARWNVTALNMPINI